MSSSKKDPSKRWAIPPQEDLSEVSRLGLHELASLTTTDAHRANRKHSTCPPELDTIHAPAEFDEEEAPSSSGFQSKQSHGDQSSPAQKEPSSPSHWVHHLSEPFSGQTLHTNATSEAETSLDGSLSQSKPAKESEQNSGGFDYRRGLQALAEAGRARARRQSDADPLKAGGTEQREEKTSSTTEISNLAAIDSVGEPIEYEVELQSETLPAPAPSRLPEEIEVRLSKARNKV